MDAYNNNNFFNNLVVAYGINLIAYTIALLLIISTLTMFRRAPTTSLLAWGESSAHPQMRFSIIVALLSLSGVPPLFGFFSKFFLILAIATKGSWLTLVVFGIFNLFALYFYFQQLRYITHNAYRKEHRALLSQSLTPKFVAPVWAFTTGVLLFGGAFSEGLVLLLSNIGA